jgi:hypothetical protein
MQNWFLVGHYKKFLQSHTHKNMVATRTLVATDFAAELTQFHIFQHRKAINMIASYGSCYEAIHFLCI